MSDAAWPYLRMALNNAWANATFYAALSGLSEETMMAERPGFFASLGLTLNHIYLVDLYYLDALEQGGEGRAVFDRHPITVITDLAAAQAGTDKRLIRFCRNLSAQNLVQTRRTDRPGGAVDERVDALLLHLFQHQIHHRGQAHVQLHHAGIAPPQLDEFYLQFEKAPSAQAYC
jgi:uncharacterized damage-inducible protein DinB